MIIDTNIKNCLQKELIQAKAIWIASAMISNNGWSFIQSQIPKEIEQHFLIGIDLSTPPSVFESILNDLTINARVFENQYTFHPKVYIIKKTDESYTAFIGSSNTTSWGLEKNIEMNYRVNNQEECKKLINWFNQHFDLGYLITKDFLDNYKTKFVRASFKRKEVESDIADIKNELGKDDGQFFKSNQHAVFAEKYHEIENDELYNIRKSVRDKLKELHNRIYPSFEEYGLIDIYPHYSPQDIVSKHFFNPYSGYYIDALWLHYGKSEPHIKSYGKSDQFINHTRLQVIILEESVGTWLILGMSKRSKIDRNHLRDQMEDSNIRNHFYQCLKQLDNDYWIEFDGWSKRVLVKDINTPEELHEIIKQERFESYFIIGKDFQKNDKKLSENEIANTVLQEFEKLYPLYLIMRHQ